MKVLLLTSNPGFGGAEKSLIRLATSLKREGLLPTLVFLSTYGNNQTPDDIETVFLTDKNTNRFGFFEKFILVRRLNKLMRKLGTFSVVSTLPLADEINFRSRSKRKIYRLANVFAEQISSIKNAKKRVRRLSRYKKIYSSGQNVALTQSIREELEHFLGCNPYLLTVIHNYVDLQNIESLTKENIEIKGQFCIHVARFASQKRHDLLIKTWKAFPDLPLLVLLCNPNEELMQLIESNGLTDRIFVAGHHKNPYKYIAKSEALILCSDYEGFPTVILEGMACTTKVIITDGAAGSLEIMNDRKSNIAKHNDIESLGETITKTLNQSKPIYQNELNFFSEKNAVEAWVRVIRDN